MFKFLSGKYSSSLLAIQISDILSGYSESAVRAMSNEEELGSVFLAFDDPRVQDIRLQGFRGNWRGVRRYFKWYKLLGRLLDDSLR